MPRYRAVDWVKLVAGVKANDTDSMNELYRVFDNGMRYYICRQLGPQDLEDRLNSTWVIVVKAIQSDMLRHPGRLMGFVRTVVRRDIYRQIEEIVLSRKRYADCDVASDLVPDQHDNPEMQMQLTERRRLIQAVLRQLNPKDSEVLIRFYLDEQDEMQIRSEMHMTETQFRLCKSRAKAKFGQIGMNMLNPSFTTRLSRLSDRTN